MNKADPNEYIEYLENRIEKLTINTSVNNQDLSTLIDAQNEVVVSSASSLKTILSTGNNYTNQFALLQNKLIASDLFMDYLTNSIWWKITSPFRHLSRSIKNRKTYSPFDFGTPTPIQDKICIIIYTSALTGALKEQITNLQKQKYFTSLEITLIDFANSNKLASYAKTNELTYIPLKATNYDLDLASILVDKKAQYVVYLTQGTFIKNLDWIYKLVYPITKDYTNLSILYKDTKNIRQIKKNTFFKELKNRIISLEEYECLFLPLSRDGIQYIPYSVTDNACAIAKRHA